MESNNLKMLIIAGLSLMSVSNGISAEEVTSTEDIFVPLEETAKQLGGIFNPKLDEADAEYWRQNAQQYLKDVLEDPQKQMKPRKAKNVIIFLGDGMSLATVAATRMYLGGEEKQLSFEKFPHFGLSKTYCVDKQVADSACTATAYLTGVKANYGTIGVSAKVELNDCVGQNNPAYRTTSIAKWAQDQCKATGFVTTSKVTDASPAGLYSLLDITKPIYFTPFKRYWQSRRKFKIVLAGGRAEFRDASVLDEDRKPGKRGDKKDLIDEWVQSRSQQGKTQYIYDKKGLDTLSNDTEYVLGLFNDDHCPYNVEVMQNRLPKPTLSEMTEVAVKHLLKYGNENGFFLFVEGARIDMAHHDNWARIALDETREFSKAIEITRNLTSEEDTLIVVTADHSHTMSYSGYSKRGSDILGLNGEKGLDGLPYTTLSYANGVGFYSTYHKNGTRLDLSQFDLTNPYHRYPATVPLTSETHGGEDVGIWASGPESYMFIGNYEQSYIPILMAHAAKMGPFAEDSKCSSSSSIVFMNVSLLLSSLLLAIMINS